MGPFTVYSLDDLEAEAKQKIVAAQSQAQQILLKAQEEAVRIREQARLEGHEAGRQQALDGHLQTESRELSEIRGVIKTIASILDAKRDELMRDAERHLIRLSVSVARKIMHREVTLNEEAILPLVRSAIEACIKEGELVVRMHPADVVILQKYMDRLKKDLPGDVSLTLVDDAQLARGDCSVQTRSGRVDARIQEELSKIEKRLMGESE